MKARVRKERQRKAEKGKGIEMSDYIRICEVEKYYGSASNVTRAVDRVSFQVDKGEFVGSWGLPVRERRRF